MEKIANWLVTPMRFLPWWHVLLIGTIGGFVIGVLFGYFMAG